MAYSKICELSYRRFSFSSSQYKNRNNPPNFCSELINQLLFKLGKKIKYNHKNTMFFYILYVWGKGVSISQKMGVEYKLSSRRDGTFSPLRFTCRSFPGFVGFVHNRSLSTDPAVRSPRSRIHERTISLWFLGIIKRVRRLQVSFYKCLHYKPETTFCH